MKKILTLLFAVVFSTTLLKAQSNNSQLSNGNTNPFLFSVNTLTGNTPKWNLNYTGSYGQHTSGQFGYDGLDQRFAAKGYLGNKFTIYANAAIGFANNGGTRSSQQAEIIKDFIGGKKVFGPRLGFGVGVNRDWDGVGAVFSRITGSVDALKWRLGGNLLFEKAFSGSRDKIDFTTSVGFHHQLAGSFFAGVEAVGQDLEGFWEEDEAEGGAKLLIGPSLNYAPSNAKVGFSVCGGPVFYATKSSVLPSNAIRDLSTQNGYTVRAMLTYNFNN
ncbi:hypothetical protein A5893_05190 [Pedobacter psychrophilus]|uniref:Outer membrane protein beta-barrel domain-containing protein n=1 Tax=Pedobacter psychrophilus TaxID=1826909 RepID=A0A179DIG6_9SPHI|nr:hypothetical protein [Pedobacter psychrophilus]OAQ40349.1 hypothetical protein A5893_05190 [Pedobacter psychrophilus]